MSLLSPWMLYGLGMLAAPILIHLWQRRRVVQVPFSTLRFLKLVAAKTSRSSRIENVLLLLLRCLVFALLVMAAARPVLTTKGARLFGGNAPRTVVLAIDHSMSMSYRAGDSTRLEAAKKQALAVLDDLKADDDVAVMAVDDRPQLLIAQPTVDHAVARRMIEAIRPGEERSDFSIVFQQAAKIVARGSHGMRELYFFTDNQTSGWHFDPSTAFDQAWTKSELHPVIVRPDNLAGANTAVKELRMKNPLLTPGGLVSGVAVVSNFSDHLSQNLLEIEIGGERVAQKPIQIAPDASVEVPFEFQAPPVFGRWARGVASIEEDNLPGDDRFYFAVPVYQPPRVLVVEGQNAGAEHLHSGFYLTRALTAGGPDISSIKTIPVSQLEDTPLENFTTVFLAGVPALGDRAVVELDSFLHAGGTVALFPGDLADVGNLARIDFLPAKPLAIRDLPAGRLATRITDPAHPLFANTWDADTPFPALPQRRIMDWKLNGGAKALVTFSNNAPFLIFGQYGSGHVIVLNASADRAWGDLPLSPAFLPLVQQIALLPADQGGAAANFTVGDALPGAASLSRDEVLSVKYPDGSAPSLPAGEKSWIVDRAEQSGFYEVSSTREGTLQMAAVNADRRESDLKPIDSLALSKIVPAETVSGIDDLRLYLARRHGTAPLWPVLLLLALAVFAAEAILANLMARNRAQGESERIETGRLNKRRIGVSFRPGQGEAA